MHVRRIELASEAPEQARALARTIRALSPPPPDVGAAVAEIVAAVRDRGDSAVVELTRRFDSESAPEDLGEPPSRLEAGVNELVAPLREAL
jgi:histidinol dehydrogenase